MTTTVLTLSWSTSRGQDTYGYTIARLDDESTGKRYRCMGGGYDMVGTVFAEWLQETRQDALQHEWVNIREEYGARLLSNGTVRLDGACGLESIRRIAQAIGLTVRSRVNKRGHVAGFIVEQTS